MVRMGVGASLAEDQRAFGRSLSVFVRVDDEGNELGREQVEERAGLSLDVVQFVDLNDGRRVTSEAIGQMRLSVEADCSVEHLHDELREMVFEDELRDADPELAEEPRWVDFADLLREVGIEADDTTLEALPFVFELDDEVIAAIAR